MKKYSGAKEDWYFTFGAGQLFDGQYVIVKHETFVGARMKMVSRYGIGWSAQYSASGFVRAGLDSRMELLEDI